MSEQAVMGALDAEADRSELPSGSRVRANGRLSRRGYSALGLLVLFALWQLGTIAGVIDSTFTSSPLRVAQTLGDLFASGDIWIPIGATFSEVGIALLITLAATIPVGLIIGRVKWLYSMTAGIIDIFNSIPFVLFLPIIIFWFGLGAQSRLTIIIWAATMPLVINTISGVRNIDRDYIRVAKVFCVGRIFFYRSVLLPATLPFILAGIRLAVARALVGAMVAEFFLAGDGLGTFVQLASTFLDMDRAMAGIAIMAAAAVSLTHSIGMIERRFTHWSQSAS